MAATDDDGLAQDISSEDEDYDDEDGSDNDADAQGGSRRGAYSRKKSRGKPLFRFSYLPRPTLKLEKCSELVTCASGRYKSKPGHNGVHFLSRF